MGMTEVKSNVYNMFQVTENDRQIKVTNNLGRDALYGEFVSLGGYFGEIREYGGIANGATGYINIDHERTVKTEQVEATDTFVVGNVLYFQSGGAGAAGKFVDAAGAGIIPVGIITGEEGVGGAQTAVEFRPFLQKANVDGLDARMTAAEADIVAIEAEPRILVFKVVADASGGLAIPGLAEGDEIIGAYVICTDANVNGTLKITDGTDDITDAIACATDKAIDYAASIDDAKSTLPAAGAEVVAGGDDATLTRGILVITYIPA